MYLDFESTLEKLERKEDQNTQKLQRHTCNSYSYVCIGPDGKKVSELSQFYRGPDPSKHCLRGLQFAATEIKSRLQAHRDVPKLNPEQKKVYEEAELCQVA